MVNLFEDCHLVLLAAIQHKTCRSRWPCGLRRSGSIAGIAGSNFVEDVDVRLLCVCLGSASATG